MKDVKQTEEKNEVKNEVAVKVCKSPDITTVPPLGLVPTPRIHDLVKKLKIKYPILFAVLVVVSFCLGAGLSGGLTKLINYLYVQQTPDE